MSSKKICEAGLDGSVSHQNVKSAKPMNGLASGSMIYRFLLVIPRLPASHGATKFNIGATHSDESKSGLKFMQGLKMQQQLKLHQHLQLEKMCAAFSLSVTLLK